MASAPTGPENTDGKIFDLSFQNLGNSGNSRIFALLRATEIAYIINPTEDLVWSGSPVTDVLRISMIIVMFGAPGVGKGTQAALLAERNGLPHLSTGEAFRQAIAAGTEMGVEAKGYVESGRLVPDEVVTGIVKETLSRPEFENGCILDGFPRTLSQAHALDRILQSQGQEISKVVNIDVPDWQIIERMLKRGRKDDREDVIRDRLEIYSRETSPLIDYYTQAGKVFSVDGNAEVEEVYARIAGGLNGLLR